MSFRSDSSAAKRIMTEVKEMQKDPSSEYTAGPLEENIFEWHFTMRGPIDSPFAEGLYHGKILLPTDYPFQPPHIMFLTPNGRWKVDTKVCVTFTGFHSESWQPAWSIRTALLGVQALMVSRQDESGFGSLSKSDEEREALAKQSVDWYCPQCQLCNKDILKDRPRKPVNTPSMLPGTPKSAAQPREAGQEPSAQPAADQQDTSAALASPRVPERTDEPVKDDGMRSLSTQSPMPERPVNSRTEPSPKVLALYHQELSSLQSRIVSSRRILVLLDSLMGMVSALLVLVILKNL